MLLIVVLRIESQGLDVPPFPPKFLTIFRGTCSCRCLFQRGVSFFPCMYGSQLASLVSRPAPAFFPFLLKTPMICSGQLSACDSIIFSTGRIFPFSPVYCLFMTYNSFFPYTKPLIGGGSRFLTGRSWSQILFFPLLFWDLCAAPRPCDLPPPSSFRHIAGFPFLTTPLEYPFYRPLSK